MAAGQPRHRQDAANLAAEFDPYSSAAAWFRDYAAYCGVSDDGKKISAVIMQLGRRKPLLKKPVGDVSAEMPDSECPAPVWERAFAGDL